jgi:hypothetical protein
MERYWADTATNAHGGRRGCHHDDPECFDEIVECAVCGLAFCESCALYCDKNVGPHACPSCDVLVSVKGTFGHPHGEECCGACLRAMVQEGRAWFCLSHDAIALPAQSPAQKNAYHHDQCAPETDQSLVRAYAAQKYTELSHSAPWMFTETGGSGP